MLSISDINEKQIILLNNLEAGYHLCVSQGNIIIKRKEDDEILTRVTRHKALVIIVIGYYTLTSVFMDFCKKHGIALVLLNSRLRPVFILSVFGEANFLLRQRQYTIISDQALKFAKLFIISKIGNSIELLKNIRQKDDGIHRAISSIKTYKDYVHVINRLDELMGIEGNVAKIYFKCYFGQLKHFDWQGRKPRLKLDPINVVLDMGYTLLFNYLEVNAGLFGFDVYKGFLHQLWYKRKSFICDLVEPFRCIIDKQVLVSFNLGQFKLEHFSQIKLQYQLDKEYQSLYNKILMQAIVDHKCDIFIYVRDFYRVFMRYSHTEVGFNDMVLPIFNINGGVSFINKE